ncbi:hypothetical protein FPSM_02144 [Flavobacterium psychrophilum]|nr:hypothetical protein FPSM_02144 [Flavobacterium psychrophilum]
MIDRLSESIVFFAEASMFSFDIKTEYFKFVYVKEICIFMFPQIYIKYYY